MASNHSSVNYVEPNINSSASFAMIGKNGKQVIEPWKVEDYFERAPRLEDYSIYFNLEVEICSRENISSNKTIASDVLILSYHTKPNESASTVNFMGGTKVKCGDENNTSMQYLTTNYADMYVGDLIDYGTTEMIGVKSVDIEYQNSCVPIITVKFTDVRGISLFQPTELSRTNSYQGINGINSDNVAQSFFQCFFRVPMPRFTMTIKGFYGKPVTYECMCDKFDTNFNSKTGDFDITTRFIGYSYSFLTDVSIDALLAAPYSDYGGKNGNYNSYWDKEVNSGRFKIWNKEKTERVKMPTLFEIWQEMKHLLSDTTKKGTALTEEEKTHEEEIQELQEIKSIYERWYTTLFNICSKQYGKEYCYLFKKNGKDGDYYRILILTKSNNIKSLKNDYEHFPDEFKTINKDLYAAIEKYNSKGRKFKKLKNVSVDFEQYFPLPLFNNTYLGTKGQVIFNGFDKSNKIPETQVINNVFYGVDYYDSGSTIQEIRDKENKHKRHVLEAIYDDGNDQYVKCYSIEQDYSSIIARIKALQFDADKSDEEKVKQKRIKELNKEMFSRMSWYPTVENFTRIMMAHMETLMSLMYRVASNCEGRTADELGVTTGDNGECVDVNSSKNVIPPFPRVTKNVIGDDGITKVEDTWVGEYNKGSKPFEEVDFIDGFFNAIEKMQALKKDTETTLLENKKEIIDLSNDLDLYEFAGKISLRMFTILGLNHLRLEYQNKLFNDKVLENIGKVEADNFYENVKIVNDKFLGMLRDGIITSKSIIDKITTSHKQNTNQTNCPWGERILFLNDKNNTWLDGYRISGDTKANNIYPIQNFSFNSLESIYENFNQGGFETANGDISIYTLPKNAEGGKLFKMNSDSAFGNILFTENIDLVSNCLKDANTNCNSGYTDYYNILESASTFNENSYSSWVDKVESYPSICKRHSSFDDKKLESFTLDDEKEVVVTANDGTSITYTSSDMEYFGSDAKNGNMSNYTITEVFGIKDDGKHDYDSSFKNSYKKIKDSVLKYDTITLNSKGLKTAIALLSINMYDYMFNQEFLANNKTFIFLPKLAVLQIGALCFAAGGVNKEISYNGIAKNLHVNNNGFIGRNIGNLLKEMPKIVRAHYAKYFYDWFNTSSVGKKFVDNLISEENYVNPSKETNRALLNQNSSFVKSMTSDLLKPILIINLSINTRKIDFKNFPLSQGRVEKYLDGFIERLKELYHINYTEDLNGSLIKTTDEPHQTTDDMKAELYRYMKQLYDKWIPMSSFDDWTLEHYFVDENEESSNAENMGHKFYFIDSYYNKIGDKLLVNPKNIMERIDALLGNGDISAMMLGFMADIYAYNKCMMKCIQNFFDLTQKKSMDEMFTPISFNSIKWASDVNKYSSFVVVYPYEPSKNLNIPNNEYNDDGFMLNDENETPKAIRSKSDANGHYSIPAFGVSYGKQYQSYFKSVNINMKSPIATQQSIQAKHFILQQNTNVKSRGVVSQDLYDVYSTQSYMCDVEMMGCAWVQPLMYFVLLNVPMFRGSYLIMKVKHSIRPGDMTTTFSGCRMANVSNKLVEDIFTDDDYLANGEYNDEMISNRELNADINNDCPYKIFQLWESDANVTVNDNEMEKAIKSLDFIRKNYNLTEEVAAGICGNIMQESRFNEYKVNSKSYAAGLCQWLPSYHLFMDMYSNKCESYGHWYKNESGLENNKDVNKLIKERDFNYQLKFAMDSVFKNKFPNFLNTKKASINLPNSLREAKTVNEGTTLWCNFYEKPSSSEALIDKREKFANDILNAYREKSKSNTSQPSNKNPNNKKEINQAFFDAVNKSAQATPSIGITLKKEFSKTSQNKTYLIISQENGSNDKLGIVFDMIINSSEYYSYVEEIGWVYENGGLEVDSNPKYIYCLLNEKNNTNNKKVWITLSGRGVGTMIPKYLNDGNPTLLKTLAKHAKSMKVSDFKKEVPQVNDEKILDKYKPKDCDSLFNTSENYNYSIDADVNLKDGKIRDWNVEESVKWIINNIIPPNGKGKCASHVENAIAAGGLPRMHCTDNGGPDEKATNLRYYGILEKNHFDLIHSSTVEPGGNTSFPLQAGDICIIGHKNYGKYHACMWTGKKWYSDYVQNNMISNNYPKMDSSGTKLSPYPYAIFRYYGKK